MDHLALKKLLKNLKCLFVGPKNYINYEISKQWIFCNEEQ